MIYIALSIVTTSLIIILFKLFNYFKVNTFLAIVINYFIASIFGFSVSSSLPGATVIFSQAWLPVTFIAGVLFITIFQFMALTTQKIGISVATVASKMSVVIPVVAAFFLYGDDVTVFKVIGLIIALVSVILSSIKPNNIEIKSTFIQKITLPGIVFFGSGMVDLAVNYIQVNYSNKLFPIELLLSFIFVGAFVAGIVFLLISFLQGKKIKLTLKSLIFGFLLGILNYLSVFFLMKAIESNILQSSALFPINNMAVVMLTSCAGYFFFKEKISFINLAGIILAILAIFLIMLS